MKNITDKAIIYLRKIISANLYWYGKTPFNNEHVRESAVNRIVLAITKRYDLVEKDKDHRS